MFSQLACEGHVTTHLGESCPCHFKSRTNQ